MHPRLAEVRHTRDTKRGGDVVMAHHLCPHRSIGSCTKGRQFWAKGAARRSPVIVGWKTRQAPAVLLTESLRGCGGAGATPMHLLVRARTGAL